MALVSQPPPFVEASIKAIEMCAGQIYLVNFPSLIWCLLGWTKYVKRPSTRYVKRPSTWELHNFDFADSWYGTILKRPHEDALFLRDETHATSFPLFTA